MVYNTIGSHLLPPIRCRALKDAILKQKRIGWAGRMLK